MGEAKQTGQTATGHGLELGPSAAPAQGGHNVRSRQSKRHADSHRGVLVHRVCGWGLGTDTGLAPYPSSSGWRLANRKGSMSLELAALPWGLARGRLTLTHSSLGSDLEGQGFWRARFMLPQEPGDGVTFPT